MHGVCGLARSIIGSAQYRERMIVAIAGPPASGKSTLSEKLREAINFESGEDICAVAPLDGFHLDNAVLDTLGLRHRKGAPETFDAEGFVRLIRQLKDHEGDVSVPTFDRTLDRAVPQGTVVKRRHRIVLAEGNYLLLESEPWVQLLEHFSFSIFLDPGLNVLEKRLVERWLEHGLDLRAARERSMSNDIPNARLVLENSREADLTLR